MAKEWTPPAPRAVDVKAVVGVLIKGDDNPDKEMATELAREILTELARTQWMRPLWVAGTKMELTRWGEDGESLGPIERALLFGPCTTQRAAALEAVRTTHALLGKVLDDKGALARTYRLYPPTLAGDEYLKDSCPECGAERVPSNSVTTIRATCGCVGTFVFMSGGPEDEAEVDWTVRCDQHGAKR